MKPCVVLNAVVDKSSFEAVNATAGESLDCPMQSVDDEQIIVRAAFQVPVKISHISFRCAEPEKGPRRVLLFTNMATPSFDDVDSMKPQQTLELTSDDVKDAKAQELKYVNFQNVRSLCLFIDGNQAGGECTRVDQIVLYGVPSEAIDMQKWAPKEDTQG